MLLPAAELTSVDVVLVAVGPGAGTAGRLILRHRHSVSPHMLAFTHGHDFQSVKDDGGRARCATAPFGSLQIADRTRSGRWVGTRGAYPKEGPDGEAFPLHSRLYRFSRMVSWWLPCRRQRRRSVSPMAMLRARTAGNGSRDQPLTAEGPWAYN
jgi:hypothetical protein